MISEDNKYTQYLGEHKCQPESLMMSFGYQPELSQGAIMYYSYYVADDMIKTVEGEREAGFYLPFLALLLNAMANRFIRRDEQLVRSVDRLR